MRHFSSMLSRTAVVGAAFAIFGLAPLQASAQVKVNSLYGKDLNGVEKILGKPTKLTGNPITYSEFNIKGTVGTQVWYRYNTGIVNRVRFYILDQPGISVDKLLKEYGLSLGPNPQKLQMKPPSLTVRNSGPVPGQPWANIAIGKSCAIAFMTSAMDYCKAHGLKPAQTYFWTVQVVAGKGGQSNVMSDRDTGGKGGKGKGKGKSKG